MIKWIVPSEGAQRNGVMRALVEALMGRGGGGAGAFGISEYD